ncbi:MAG: F0F1 ATP synthase subunit A [Oscillospiraceae bacterium]|nr:F0F1 ATP synthase subunit A [Oscillospiraceae bacterium]
MTFKLILLGVSVLIAVLGLLWRKSVKKKLAAMSEPTKKAKRPKTLATAVTAIGIYMLLTCLITIIFGSRESEGLEFSLWPERIDINGFSLSITTIYTWIAMAVLIIAAIIIRLTIVRNFKDTPTGAQNVLETVVEQVRKYTSGQAHGTGEFLCSYILSVGSLMVMSAFLELFRLRPPTADITMTFSLAFLSFIMINLYGIKRKGIGGRIKALASPTPVVFLFRVISEIAIPVSMACRLFGNMLGGMIVIDLLYMALGNGAVGIPSVAGLYFNVFHPLMQTFIFVTLTLTFINEAIE